MSLEELADPALAHEIGPDLVAGTAIAHRFVDTEAVAFRGYDISITSAIAGLADSDQVMFVTTRDRLPGVSLGTDLLVFGRRGPGLLEIRSVGHCQPLISVAP